MLLSATVLWDLPSLMEAVTLSNSTECSEAASHLTFFAKLVKEQPL